MTYRIVKDEPCPECGGSGCPHLLQASAHCSRCKGHGTVAHETTAPDDATILIHKGDIYVMRKAHT